MQQNKAHKTNKVNKKGLWKHFKCSWRTVTTTTATTTTKAIATTSEKRNNNCDDPWKWGAMKLKSHTDANAIKVTRNRKRANKAKRMRKCQPTATAVCCRTWLASLVKC